MNGHPWHDISIEPQLVGVVEIPAGSHYKYELEKKNGGLILDRVIPLPIPANYGFIPRTLSQDNDPLDIYVLSDHAIPPLTQVKLNVIGVILMTDNGENDEKILCVIEGDASPRDPSAIATFLASYKPGIVIHEFLGVNTAWKIIEEAKERYFQKFSQPL